MYLVVFGQSRRPYYTFYHAEQLARALILNKAPVQVLDLSATKSNQQTVPQVYKGKAKPWT